MKPTALTLIVTAAFILLVGITPGTTVAVELIVEKDPTDPTHYSSIQAAIDAAYSLATTTTGTVTYSVRVEDGIYSEAITLKSNIPVQGRETAKTILSGGGSGTIINANGVTNTSISNFTFQNAGTAISVSNNATIDIMNNIFNLGTAGTAIQIQSAQSTNIFNNVFYLNGHAISTNIDATITNNIFYKNTTALLYTLTPTTLNNLSYNAFSGNQTDSSISQTGTATVTTDNPLFVDVVNNDFHLMSGSPCISSGNPSSRYNNPGYYPNSQLNPPNPQSDMGAYGGPSTDTIPFQIFGVNPAPSSGGIYLWWKSNNSYLVSGYRVYYGTSPGVYTGTEATEGPSPINVTTTTATLSGLPTTVAAPSGTTLSTPQVLNESLGLSWPAATGATSYIVSYSTSTFDASTLSSTTRVNVGNNTSYTLAGLQNGQTYYVAVSAVAQKTYYITVTAFDSAGTSTTNATPGIDHESAYAQEISVTLGNPVEGPLSNPLSSFPEALTAYPPLPNGQHQGCFIATAAYGHYTAPEVQALREFRDRYLLTNKLGRAFVSWYYQRGPAAAAALNAHPEYKPVVRAALMPAVGVALFLTRTSLFLKLGLMLIAGCAGAFMAYRKRFSASGGGH